MRTDYACDMCLDTGWVRYTRPSPTTGLAVSYVRPCGCRAHNGVYHRRRDREATRVQTRQAATGRVKGGGRP